MATGYIVWDSKNRRIVAGPFNANSDATTALNRAQRRNDSRETEKKSKDQGALFTVETVTLT